MASTKMSYIAYALFGNSSQELRKYEGLVFPEIGGLEAI